MRTARATLDPAFTIGAIDQRLFGSFVEHMGRCVYTGIYEPEHPTSDAEGSRQDVLELVRELGVSTVRYPGGNFVSGYRWEDGIGPVGERPTRLDLAWRSIETNAFGLDEFIDWTRKAGVEPMLAVNLGTRGIQEACDLLEYTNHPSGTHWSDLRRKNGHHDPHGVKLWCLGNEMDGPWQIGHYSADEYGRIAARTAQAMKLIDPTIELVACGSSSRAMPTFGAWESTVLQHTYEHVDYISLHAYYQERDGDLASFLASATDMDAFIEAVVATCDHVAARLRQRKTLKLSFDEWNVWYQTEFDGPQSLGWHEAPAIIEDSFSLADAVVVGSLLISLLRHADRVGVACQAQLANIIAPILTRPGGPAWRQTTFYPFAQAAAAARGVVLRMETVSPTYDTSRYGEVPLLHSVATYDEDAGELSVFAVNRDLADTLTLEVDLRALPGWSIADCHVLADSDVRAANTSDQPDRVRPRSSQQATIRDDTLVAQLPPVSWNVLRLTRRPTT